MWDSYGILSLLITTFWANTADDKLTIFFLFFPEIGSDISIGSNLHEMSNPVS